LNICRNTT